MFCTHVYLLNDYADNCETMSTCLHLLIRLTWFIKQYIKIMVEKSSLYSLSKTQGLSTVQEHTLLKLSDYVI